MSGTRMEGVRLGVVRGISYGLFAPPDVFLPAARAMGAGLLRAYVYWAQVEPEPGHYTWDTVDALLAQLDGDEEVWLTVCSSSPWATRQSTNFLPPSPANDLDAYAEFVRRLVDHCAGRIRYWQCDNEPSNTGLLWAGTAEEYVAQLRAFHDAVKASDPAAVVVLGGCGYDVWSSPEGSEQRRFFDHLTDAGRDSFDLFDAHLYGEPTRVPDYVAAARDMMRAHGYEKPVVAGEHAGPVLFEFPELDAAIQQVFATAFAEPQATQSTDELAAQAGRDTPERRAMAALYARVEELPPRLRMFMDGCGPELEAKRHRINCRQLVVRTVLALDAGVRRLAYWNLAPEVAGWHDPYQMMHLMFGKLPLLDFEDGALTRRHPAAETFALLAERLDGLSEVWRIDVGRPEAYVFAIERAGRARLLVAWEHRDWFDGEEEPPATVLLPWPAPVATAVDAFGDKPDVRVSDGVLRLPVSATPVFVE
ncbi:MAG TPA: hypothetical protein VKB69_00750 [Micromonosporaceae bacterium]|nr:hypothetical protein [Micromonosporaceae bacterium]